MLDRRAVLVHYGGMSNDDRPVYLRLRDTIAALILDGRVSDGAPLPSRSDHVGKGPDSGGGHCRLVWFLGSGGVSAVAAGWLAVGAGGGAVGGEFVDVADGA